MARAREVWRGVAWTTKGRGEVRNISVLGKRQVTLRWVDDPVLRHYGCWLRGFLVSRGVSSPEGHWTAGREGGGGQE